MEGPGGRGSILHMLTLRVSERKRLKKTDCQTEMQKGKGTQTPATKYRHRPLPTQLTYAHSQVHTHFPNSDTPLRECQTFTKQTYTDHKHTLQNPKHIQLRIYIFPDSQGQIQFQSHTCVHIQCSHTTTRSTDTSA